MNNNKLKPVVFVQSTFNVSKDTKHANNKFQQTILLKALTVTQDPKELKKMIGVKTVAEVYRTLDKLALRKEYHKALADHGLDFDFIVKGMKELALNSYKDADKLNAFKALLKSLGMDKYDETTSGGGSWEDTLLAAIEKGGEKPKQISASSSSLSEDYNGGEIEEYDVIEPEVPISVRRQVDEEKQLNKSIYG